MELEKDNHTVYAIASLSRNYIYVGMTSNLDNRLKRHNNGYEKTTKPYAPFELIYNYSNAEFEIKITDRFVSF